MATDLQAWVNEAQATGTLAGLPDGHWIDGAQVPSRSGAPLRTI